VDFKTQHQNNIYMKTSGNCEVTWGVGLRIKQPPIINYTAHE